MKNAPRICIIENERLIGLDLKLQLEKLGYRVYGPYAGEEYEKVVAEGQADLMIVGTGGNPCHCSRDADWKPTREKRIPLISIGMKHETFSHCRGVELVCSFTKPFDQLEVITAVQAQTRYVTGHHEE